MKKKSLNKGVYRNKNCLLCNGLAVEEVETELYGLG